MDGNAIVSLIGSVGFPIVCCGALWYTMNNALKDVKQALDNNTQVLSRILQKLDIKEEQ